jgi:hypothetical protein
VRATSVRTVCAAVLSGRPTCRTRTAGRCQPPVVARRSRQPGRVGHRPPSRTPCLLPVPRLLAVDIHWPGRPFKWNREKIWWVAWLSTARMPDGSFLHPARAGNREFGGLSAQLWPRTDGGCRTGFVGQAAFLIGRWKGQPGRVVRCLASRSSSLNTAARTANTLSAPSSFQNFSVPFTR